MNIILDGNIVKGIPGETILQLAERHGIIIPTLCNDDRLEPFSSCYVCVVEVEGMRGHQPSCSTKITEGMKIITNNEGIRKSRKMALELMLSNHYADCLGPCKQTCPAGVDVQGYISLIEKGLYRDAIALIKETNPLPAICGRVCVRPCEVECRRNLLDENAAVGIDYLKRFAADQDLKSDNKFMPETAPSTGKKVAVIGAGPGGLSAAYFLQKKGHQVDIFEAAPKSGGWLRYGIPEYRLPNDIIDKEVESITAMGVNIHYRKRLGDNLSFKEIKDDYQATVLTIGSQRGTSIGCEGDDAENVFSGIDFLKNMEVTGQRYDFTGKTIAVIGGGNTAMDCCRTSIRCKADKVYVIYRRTEKEMPANPIEIHESKLEGVEYLFLTLPKIVNKDENGALKSITCLKMELGEPDASGRRRPVPVEGSEFTIDVDYALAAIGQKTDVNFINDINAYAIDGQLVINKWGDIDAKKDTLQTGIPSVFAAGDGVTGPATIIEAIAQAKIAAESVHQYLSGEPIIPVRKPFTSRKDNFKKQVKADYEGRYLHQIREEMPTLHPQNRNNFSEVELGYSSAEIALHETQRCLECGCTAFLNCDLQKYSTEYNADQRSFKGEFREYQVDFSHPYIEFDNNKCILCGRCIRICREVAGAKALGFVNRGFDTFVAPSMGDSLRDTPCESCGLCISTCPTGAITENVIFKPGPVKTDEGITICNYCSVGCTINLHHKNGFVMGVTGAKGIVNFDGNLCRYPKFGYRVMNDRSRILKPLKRNGETFEEISFEEAFKLIHERIIKTAPDENAFFAGSRLSNEEMYLIQKLARAAVKTNNVGSFHYLGRGDGYRRNNLLNASFSSLNGAGKIYFIGTEINQDHAVAGFFAQKAHYSSNVPQVLVTTKETNTMEHKMDEVIRVSSYYHFIKAVTHYLLTNNLENGLFLRDRTEGFDHFKENLLKENYNEILLNAGITAEEVKTFAEDYNMQMNAIILFSEKEISDSASTELLNLAIITGKLGKTSNGLISLREKNNSQGLFDMGIDPEHGVGGQLLTSDFLNRVMDCWKVQSLPENSNDLLELITCHRVKNLFIFGEDPVGCATSDETDSWFGTPAFTVVQDYFMTDTALQADIILPASFPAETGGSFTNTGKIIQEFEPVLPCPLEKDNLMQLSALLSLFGNNGLSTSKSILSEMITLLPASRDHSMLKLEITDGEDSDPLFESGCDVIVQKFEKDFAEMQMEQKDQLILEKN